MFKKEVITSSTSKFKEEANTFCLNLIKYQDRLIITLRDYTNWWIYEKEYTENDIGKEIHKKIDLNDICHSFTQIAPENDQKTTEGESQHKQYVFGQKVNNHNGPAYKIESDGRVTVYTNVIYKRPNEVIEETFQSKLKLLKVRALKQFEVYCIKTELQNKQLNDTVRELDKVKEEYILIEQTVKNLRKENKKLLGAVSRLQKCLEPKVKKIRKKKSKSNKKVIAIS